MHLAYSALALSFSLDGQCKFNPDFVYLFLVRAQVVIMFQWHSRISTRTYKPRMNPLWFILLSESFEKSKYGFTDSFHKTVKKVNRKKTYHRPQRRRITKRETVLNSVINLFFPHLLRCCYSIVLFRIPVHISNEHVQSDREWKGIMKKTNFNLLHLMHDLAFSMETMINQPILMMMIAHWFHLDPISFGVNTWFLPVLIPLKGILCSRKKTKWIQRRKNPTNSICMDNSFSLPEYLARPFCKNILILHLVNLFKH